MQPENSRNATPGFEQLPMPPTVGVESVPNLPPLGGSGERGLEQVEQVAEARAQVADAAATTTAAIPTAPVAPVRSPQGNVSASSATPLVAADEDLIEKEWVDKAKEIIEQTQGDPHARTQKVNELQRDYLQKRYGKVVGANE